MANNSEDGIVYWLLMHHEQQDKLGYIRDWENVKVGISGNEIWLKGLTKLQVSSYEIQTILNKTIFTEKNGFLFLLGNLLPWKKEPSLVWTNINRAFQVYLPKLNHNFFHLEEQINIQLVPSLKEKDPAAQLVYLNDLEDYLTDAPHNRLENITWAIIDKSTALLVGYPILPIRGPSFWKNKQFLLPVGWDFEFDILIDSISEKLQISSSDIICCLDNNNNVLIRGDKKEQLSRSSFLLTKEKIMNQ